MKFTMRDKICKLIGKYENMEQDFATSAIIKGFACAVGVKTSGNDAEAAAKAEMCSRFSSDLKQLLEEDDAQAAPEDPRNTAPAGKWWCADSAVQAAESTAKEARNNG